MSDMIVFPAPADPKATKMIISMAVRRLMVERGVTQMALAGALQLPQSSISKRLRGLVAWDADDLDRLVEVFGVPVEALLLPRLDLNQQPAGYTHPLVAPVIHMRPGALRALAASR